jgi:hypothetical protein
MRRQKRLVILAGLGVVLAVGVSVLWPQPTEPGLTQENFDRIRIGMTRSEVEAILGPWSSSHSVFGDWNYNLDAGIFSWSSHDRESASVWFDDQGKVGAKSSNAFLVEPHGPFNGILWRFKRQWHRWFPEK